MTSGSPSKAGFERKLSIRLATDRAVGHASPLAALLVPAEVAN